MNCPKCRGSLEVVQTVSCPAGKTQRLECSRPGCGATFVGVVLIANEIGDKGTGIHAVMKKMRAGKVRLEK